MKIQKRDASLAVLLMGSLFAGCHEKVAPLVSENLPSAAVRAQTVERKSRAATEDVVGTVRPKLSAAIEAKVRTHRANACRSRTVGEGW